jgi:hypothetical protein
MAMTRTKTNGSTATIEVPNRQILSIDIIGDTPYVGTNFAIDVQEALLNKQSGKGKTKTRAARDVDAEVFGRRHIIKGVDAIPITAFWAAVIDTAKDKLLTGTSGEDVRRSTMIQGDLGAFTTIRDQDGNQHPGPETMSAVVKLASGARHIAYRPSYENWTAKISVVYFADKFSAQDIINLLVRAGLTTGVGDTRRIGGGRFHPGKDAQVTNV